MGSKLLTLQYCNCSCCVANSWPIYMVNKINNGVLV